LSYNNFALEECQLISCALAKNQTIIGFHFAGNHGYIDPNGYLIINNIKELSREFDV